ncbi:MAG: phosphoglucosamine mutase [Candidatus Thorarchaeota archaeon]|nr:MAG: phosphoglucosamine mutase [Candidatus Thorarchaeota archaeon]
MTDKLFGTSGIRGSILEKSTPDLALNLGRALGSFLEGTGTVGVGVDARTSNEMLRNSLVAGLLSTGVDVVDLGIAPMPAVAYYSQVKGIAASVIVTASHNPPADNGFKFFNNGREFVRVEEVFLETAIAKSQYIVAKWDEIGKIRHLDIKEQYLDHLKIFLSNRGTNSSGTKVLADLANGAATEYTPQLLLELGFSVTTMNSHQDGHFPGRPAEPSPGNLVDTMKMAANSDFAVTVCHDGDGDRLAVIDEQGEFIDQNRVIALFARDEVKRNGGGIVVVSIDTSSVIDELVTAVGGTVTRMPLGSLQEFFTTDNGKDVVFASEPWKPIFTKMGCWMDGIAGAARFAQMVDEIGDGSCMKLMETIPKYPILRDFVPCPDSVKPNFLPKVKELLVPQMTGVSQILEVDGIRIECTDGSYVLVRVPGTEPKARVYVGAKEQATVDKLATLAKDVMAQVLDELQK